MAPSSPKEERFAQLEREALKASRNLHRVFTRYLLGFITWDEFCDECKKRESNFEEAVKTKSLKIG